MMISKLCGVYMDLIIQSGESLSIYPLLIKDKIVIKVI